MRWICADVVYVQHVTPLASKLYNTTKSSLVCIKPDYTTCNFCFAFALGYGSGWKKCACQPWTEVRNALSQRSFCGWCSRLPSTKHANGQRHWCHLCGMQAKSRQDQRTARSMYDISTRRWLSDSYSYGYLFFWSTNTFFYMFSRNNWHYCYAIATGCSVTAWWSRVNVQRQQVRVEWNVVDNLIIMTKYLHLQPHHQ